MCFRGECETVTNIDIKSHSYARDSRALVSVLTGDLHVYTCNTVHVVADDMHVSPTCTYDRFQMS